MENANAPDQSVVQIALRADALRSDLVLGLVWFINYAAIDPSGITAKDLDLHGAAMLPADVELFAHRWLKHSRSIDINHDGVGRPVHVIESFFNSPAVASPSWPLNSHALRFDISGSKEAMDGMRSGDLNCVSLDAYTFNEVRRLPVAEVKALLQPQSMDEAPPESLEKWALALAQRGYIGGTEVKEVSPGMYIAERSAGLPLAVTFKEGRMEASAAGGAWQHIAASLLESGSLIGLKPAEKALDPGDGQPTSAPIQEIDYARWDESEVLALLKEEGANIPPGNEFFAAPDQLAHHTFRDGKLKLSKEGVMHSLSKVDLLPEATRQSAKDHLLLHLDQIRKASGAGTAIFGETPGSVA